MKIRIAELNIDVQHRYPLAATLCAEYLSPFEEADISVCVSDAEIEREMSAAKEPVTAAEAEFACIYRNIARTLPQFDAFVFHAATVAYKGQAFAFSAPSGTGKSTHVALWRQCFDEAYVLNGDKPIFRFLDGKLYAFGTPWCGKERMACNEGMPLVALAFLERSATNEIAPLSDDGAVRRLYHQVLMPGEDAQNLRFLDLLDAMLQTVPTYLLKCNMHPDAARVARDGMYKENL